MYAIVWLILFVILLVIEIATLGLTTIWFAGGSLVAFGLAMFDCPLWIQIVVFLIVSIALLVMTRPIAMKHFNQKRKLTNAESLIGEKAVVLEAVDTLHNVGTVVVRGQEWSAKTDTPEQSIQSGSIVTVEGIQGVKLIVKEMEE